MHSPECIITVRATAEGGDNTFPTNSVAYLPIRYLSNCRFIHKCRCGDEVSPARAVLQRYPYEVFGSGPGRPEVHLQGVPQHLALQRSCGDGAALLDISLYIDWSGRHRQPRQRWQTTFLNWFSCAGHSSQGIVDPGVASDG